MGKVHGWKTCTKRVRRETIGGPRLQAYTLGWDERIAMKVGTGERGVLTILAFYSAESWWADTLARTWMAHPPVQTNGAFQQTIFFWVPITRRTLCI